jgi:ABC-type branched-subunit amino acid transport system substrate-binding protein
MPPWLSVVVLLMWLTAHTSCALDVRLCHIPASFIVKDRSFARHALFASQWLAPQFPTLNVSFDFATANGGPTINDVAKGLLSTRAAACDGLVGPQWSSVAIGVSALVNVPWVSHTATSTQLSDKRLHPWFSRMLPTDDFGGAGMAAVARSFGWKLVSTLCVDDAYGQSLQAGFRESHAAAGGTIEHSVCLTKDADHAHVTATVESFLDIAGRVVVVSAASSVQMVDRVVDAAIALGMHRTHVFIFSESPCGSRWHRLRELHGAFCVSYGTNVNVTAAYRSAWLAADHERLFASLPALGIPEPAKPLALDFFSYFIHDAVLSLLHAFNSTGNTSGSHVLSALREQLVPEGATGPIALDSLGDRMGATVSLINVVPNATASDDGFDLEEFALLSSDGQIRFKEPQRQRYWLDGGRGPAPAVQPEVDTGFQPSAGVLIGLLACIVLFILIVAAVVKVGCSDANFVAKLVHSGVAGAFVMGLCDIADAVLAMIAAIQVAGEPGFSAAFKASYLALSGVAFVGAGIDIGAIFFFVRASLKSGGRLRPGKQKVWHLRLAVGACISLAIEDIPLMSVAFAAIALDPHNVTGLVLANFIFSSVIAGAKILEPMRLLAHAVAPAAVKLHESIQEEFAESVPFSRATDATVLHNARAYISSKAQKRAHDLLVAAKHIVVDCQGNAVSSNEFFAVVWRSMAVMYEASHATDEEVDIEWASSVEGDSDDESDDPIESPQLTPVSPSRRDGLKGHSRMRRSVLTVAVCTTAVPAHAPSPHESASCTPSLPDANTLSAEHVQSFQLEPVDP